jgi:hypothetical protein
MKLEILFILSCAFNITFTIQHMYCNEIYDMKSYKKVEWVRCAIFRIKMLENVKLVENSF